VTGGRSNWLLASEENVQESEKVTENESNAAALALRVQTAAFASKQKYQMIPVDLWTCCWMASDKYLGTCRNTGSTFHIRLGWGFADCGKMWQAPGFDTVWRMRLFDLRRSCNMNLLQRRSLWTQKSFQRFVEIDMISRHRLLMSTRYSSFWSRNARYPRILLTYDLERNVDVCRKCIP